MLKVKNLRTHFPLPNGQTARAVDGVSFHVDPGETVCIVGESGCGKSVTSFSLMQLLPRYAQHPTGEILFDGEDVLKMSVDEKRRLRGGKMAMIFQEPMTSLNPVFTVGDQIAEAIMLHQNVSRDQALRDAVALLDRVGIPSPDARARDYPHQLSGGMRQRVMIAMAVSCRPKVLIADEPTTALDVTVQAQIFDLLNEIQRDFGSAIILITHEMSVIREICSDVVVLEGGRVVETGPVWRVFGRPSTRPRGRCSNP